MILTLKPDTDELMSPYSCIIGSEIGIVKGKTEKNEKIGIIVCTFYNTMKT